MMRKCSHCGHNGHNSRTCPNRGVRLFGVRLTDGSIRKSASMGNLSLYERSAGGAVGGGSPAEGPEHGAAADGYASEDLGRGSSSSCRERKKGVPWTEDEHRMFLLGLHKLGKGDWRGIARNYVVSRTPTQVASHAQKYFIRQSNASRRKRRSSLFDIVPDEGVDSELAPMSCQDQETEGDNLLSVPPVPDEECESMDSNSNDGDAGVPNQIPVPLPCSYPVMFPAYISPFIPIPFPFWPSYGIVSTDQETHEIVRPTPVHPKETPINVNELVSMSKLTIGESSGGVSSSLSLNLPGASERQSAFHANPPARDSGMGSSTSPIHAV